MRGIIAVLIMSVMVALGASSLLAHDNFRIIGNMTKRHDRLIDVKTRDGRTVEIKVDKQTVILRDKKKIAQAELKNGQYVVVDAYGDSEDDLLAIEIQIVQPPAVRSR